MIHGNGAFCGCLFINAAAEYQDREHPIHRRSAAYKAELQSHLRELLERLDAPEPLRLARQLQYLLEGALSMAHIEGPGEQALDAKAAAECLLNAAGI
jgi:hypothetical protein